MKTIISHLLIAIFSLYVAAGSIGIMTIYNVKDPASPRGISVTDGKVIVSHSPTTFEIGATGIIKVHNSTSYLRVGDRGLFRPTDNPHGGFLLTSLGNIPKMQKLAYYGGSVFYVCKDGQIDCTGVCDGAYRISIAFQEYV